MFGSKTSQQPPRIPELTDHAPYADVLARRAKLSAELAQVTAERETVAAELAAEFGASAGALSSEDVEARILAGGDGARAERQRATAEKLRALSTRETVVAKAVSLLDAEEAKAKKVALNEHARRVFKEAFGPAVRDAGEKLLVAAKALRELTRLQTQIDMADLLIGPNSGMHLPVRLLDAQLDPVRLLEGLVFSGAVSESEAAELRKKYAA